MHSTLPKHTVVLLGVGHTNAHIARMWRMKGLPNTQLICVSNHWAASYSGMLPGVLSGQYPDDRMEIDLARFSQSVGARLIVDSVTGIDLENRALRFATRPDVPFDVLSIGIGSVPSHASLAAKHDDRLLPIKPMQTFLQRLRERIEKRVRSKRTVADTKLRITVVGAGAGGTEIAFCLPHRLRLWFPEQDFEVSLLTSSSNVATGCIPATVRLVEKELERNNIRVHVGRRVTEVEEGQLRCDTGEVIETDLAIWATGASAPAALTTFGLPSDERGFLLTEPTLQVVGQDAIFAVGDSGTLQHGATPKAGVYAVRQGPILWQNIRRALGNQPLLEFHPQRDFLTLLNLGDGRAIAQYKGMAFRGKWCWRLKDYIDSKFMDKYQDYEPMAMQPEPPDPKTQMRCTGCGGKIGGSVLSRVLRRLDVPQNDQVIVGLDHPDDAAVVQIGGGRPVTATVDFFSAPLDDPYIVGRLAALNAASDAFAIGAKPIAALTVATIPFGSPRRQEQVLYETLAGSLEEFRKMDCSLVGGHTIEGPMLTVGFTVLADQDENSLQTKGNLRDGDFLVLTKPLGSGILLAGHMQAKCRGEWMPRLLDAMLLSNQLAMEAVAEFDIPAVTDVTGFGFAGHLIEMLRASGKAAKLELSKIPILDGTAELLEQGIESTLAPANKDAESAIIVHESMRKRPEYLAMFDPQTCGGILMGVRPAEVESVVQRLSAVTDVASCVVGQVVAKQREDKSIQVI